MNAIGADVPRSDGVAKLTGRATYVDDIVMPDMLHAATIRSAIPRGRITRIDFDPAINWNEFTIVDHRDVPGDNYVKLIDTDQPVLAAAEFRHKAEPILLLAHPDAAFVRRAARLIQVHADELPAVLDCFASPAPNQIQFGDENIFKRINISKGDAAAALASAPIVIEGTYSTGPQEHVYIEPNGMLAHGDSSGRMVVRGSMQCPYYVLKGLTAAFGRADDAFRVIQTTTGGGFGGKEEFPTIVAIHAALLAEKSGRPVKLIYDRHEDMAASTKRHPCRVRHRTGLSREGRLLAMEIEIIMDGGAYVTLSPVVLSRGAIHAAGPYRCDHVTVRGEARFSNAPPYGAFRGFGAPQTIFAMERHMDVIAARLRLSPVEFRRMNLLRAGVTTATGQVFDGSPNLPALQDAALSRCAEFDLRLTNHAMPAAPSAPLPAPPPAPLPAPSREDLPAAPYPSFDSFRAALAHSTSAHPYLRRGAGFATFMHGAGFTGSGETMLASEAFVEGLPDGRVAILSANTDIGQGTETILRQVAAQSLRLPMCDVLFTTPDTSLVPNSGPTVASRTAMVVGSLIAQACADLLALLEFTSTPQADSPRNAIIRWHESHPRSRLIGKAKYRQPESIQWDDKTYRGDAYACFSYATYAAVVEVDLRTYGVRVLDFVAMQEVGRVIHPTLARGQIAGGVVQGIGWALMEEVVLEGGAMRNSQMTNYIIPTSGDLPPIRVHFDERPCQFGPGGAKGIGELPMDGPAPAIINAICHALRPDAPGSLCLNEIPMTPERLLSCLTAADA